MSALGLDMVGLSPLAVPSVLSASLLPPFASDGETMAPKNSGMPEFRSGNQEFRSGSIRDDVRELAELLAPGQSVKVQMQQVHTALSKHVRRLTERRVKGMFFGEYDRLWDDEKDGLRKALVMAKNAKARNAFHAAAAALVRGLHAAGHPLSAAQHSALNQMVGAAA